jgi:hypothetical protein
MSGVKRELPASGALRLYSTFLVPFSEVMDEAKADSDRVATQDQGIASTTRSVTSQIRPNAHSGFLFRFHGCGLLISPWFLHWVLAHAACPSIPT